MKYKNRFDNKLKNNEMVNFEDFYLWTIEEKAKAYDELIEYLKKEQERLAKETSATYEDGLGKRRFVDEEIYNEVSKILSKLEKRDKHENK